MDIVRVLSVVEGYDDDQSGRVPSLRVQVMLTVKVSKRHCKKESPKQILETKKNKKKKETGAADHEPVQQSTENRRVFSSEQASFWLRARLYKNSTYVKHKTS